MVQSQLDDNLVPQAFPNGRTRISWQAYVLGLALMAIVIAAGLAWLDQLREGLGVSGKSRPIMWSLYVTDFVFWSGIGQACIFWTAWMRLFRFPCNHSLLRRGDGIALAALFVGSVFPIIHLGRPIYFYWIVPYPNGRMLLPSLHSPLVWDFVALNSLLAVALGYIYLHLLPDLALMRDSAAGARRVIARLFAMGWKGAGKQWRHLEVAALLATILVAPVAVIANFTQSSIFSGTPNAVWKSPSTWPHFLLTSLFSGVAALVLFRMTPGTNAPEIEKTEEKAVTLLRRLLLWLGRAWIGLTVLELLRLRLRAEPDGLAVLSMKLRGEYSGLFWGTIACCFILPTLLLGIRRLRTHTTTSLAALATLVGLWLDRFLFIVPTLGTPRLAALEVYSPTGDEMLITAGSVAAFVIIYGVFTRFFPMITFWDMKRRA